jgi:type II secretory pathway pseudopilin PulG
MSGDTAVGILIVAISVISLVAVGVAFVWAARKDGEEDRALQKRLGIRRKTRLGP